MPDDPAGPPLEPRVTVSDATLVRGTLDGDRAAFAELYDRKARLIRAICYDATRDLHAAADLTQEVFLRAFARLATLRDADKFAVWLVGIARQVLHEWRRGRVRRTQSTDDPNEPLTLIPAALPFAAPHDELADLRDAIAKLPEAERIALHAFYLEEQDLRRVQASTGLSRSGLYKVLSRARRRLRGLLGCAEVHHDQP